MSDSSTGGAEENEPPKEQETQRRVVEARQLLGEDNEVWIQHYGVLYRLRLTRRGRLILTK